MNKRSKVNFSFFFFTIVFAVLVFLIGYVLGRAGFNVAWENGDFNYTFKGKFYPENKEVNFDMFWDVWSKLENEYVDKNIDEQKMFYGAIKGMVASLDDPGTFFMTPEDAEKYKLEMSGNLEGIGVLLQYYKGEVILREVYPSTPASKSGLKKGDIIVKVNGKKVGDFDNLTEISENIKGKKGTKVTLTVDRGEGSFDLEVEREAVHIDSIRWQKLENNIFYIQIIRFSDSTEEQFYRLWDKVVEDIRTQNPSGIIIDLRDNGGGYLRGAVYVAGDFLKKGEIVLYEQDREKNLNAIPVDRIGAFLNVPVVIIVNTDTASASEIFAGALQHYKRATVIGKKTFGKGTAQTPYEPANWGGARIHITTQKWLLPSKRSIKKDDPIYPDIDVDFDISIEDLRLGRDPQMERGVEELMKLL